jgi:hypothetical protein
MKKFLAILLMALPLAVMAEYAVVVVSDPGVLNLSGGTMTGDLNLGGKKLTNAVIDVGVAGGAAGTTNAITSSGLVDVSALLGASAAFQSARCRITARANLVNGTSYAVAFDAVSEGLLEWDADGWVDATDEQIDLPQTGKYRAITAINFSGLVADGVGTAIWLNSQIVSADGSTTNGVAPSRSDLSKREQTANGEKVYMEIVHFDSTAAGDKFQMLIRQWSSGNTPDVQDGTVFIEYLGD